MDDDAFDAAVGSLVNDPLIGDAEPAQAEGSVEAPVEQPNEQPVTEDSFTRFDPSALPPELMPVYKQMQGDYTRKTQEIAEFRKLGELGADPDILRTSYEFYRQMDTNPEFAKQVADYVYGRLGDKPGGVQPAAEEPSDDVGFGFDDNVPTAVQQLQEEVRAMREQLEQERILTQMQTMLTTQENSLRQANPHYDEGDWEAIYEFAAAMETPDLVAAEAQYTKLQAQWAAKFAANRNAPAPSAPSGGSFAQETVRPKTLDEATEIALQRILGQNAQ